MNTKAVRAEEIEEGDRVVIDGIPRLVEDLYENGRMNGVWLHSGGLSRFYNYDDIIQRVLTN